jgi:hypothetical protein
LGASARALQSDTSWDELVRIPAFLASLAEEAADALDLLFAMEPAWLGAAAAVAGRRRSSRAAAAVDILAAASLVSATSLAAGPGMAVKNAAALLDAFRAAGVAVEVTHRSKRRLFGLSGLAPLRDAGRPPYRPGRWLRPSATRISPTIRPIAWRRSIGGSSTTATSTAGLRRWNRQSGTRGSRYASWRR